MRNLFAYIKRPFDGKTGDFLKHFPWKAMILKIVNWKQVQSGIWLKTCWFETVQPVNDDHRPVQSGRHGKEENEEK